jgi:hypothetical protein
LVLNVLRGLSEQFQVIVRLIPRQKPLSSFNDVHADLRLAELNMTSPLLRHRRPLSPLLPAGRPPLLPRRGPVLPVPALPVGAPLVVGADAVDAVAADKVAPPLGRPAATNGRPSTTHGPGPSTCGPVPPAVVIMEHLHAPERHSHRTTPCWLSGASGVLCAPSTSGRFPAGASSRPVALGLPLLRERLQHHLYT